MFLGAYGYYNALTSKTMVNLLWRTKLLYFSACLLLGFCAWWLNGLQIWSLDIFFRLKTFYACPLQVNLANLV